MEQKAIKENKKVKNATVNVYEGIKFRSKLETYTYTKLKQAGIQNIEYEQNRYELLPKFQYNEENIRAMTYTPDFVINGNIVIECKGWANDRWGLVRKLFLKFLLDNNLNYKFYEIHNTTEVNSMITEIITETKEIWKEIPNYEGLYEASTYGNIRSIQYHGKKRIKLLRKTKKNGYYSVKLRKWPDVEMSVSVARLVAITFVENIENKPYVDHIDGNKLNNNITNLRWVTPLENTNNPNTINNLLNKLVAYNKSEKKRKRNKELFGQPVIHYDENMQIISEYESISEAARKLNTTTTCIWRVCVGERKTHKKQIFRLKYPKT